VDGTLGTGNDRGVFMAYHRPARRGCSLKPTLSPDAGCLLSETSETAESGLHPVPSGPIRRVLVQLDSAIIWRRAEI